MAQRGLGALGTMMMREMNAEVELPSQLLSFIRSDSSAARPGRGAAGIGGSAEWRRNL